MLLSPTKEKVVFINSRDEHRLVLLFIFSCKIGFSLSCRKPV